jgi:hypothetical protein
MVPFGPIMRLRAAMPEAREFVEPGQREEEIKMAPKAFSGGHFRW